MGSPIPLFGLPDKIDVLRYADADDGHGGITKGAETEVYLNKRARMTLMSDVDKSQGFGRAAGDKWDVLAVYLPDLKDGDRIKVRGGWQDIPEAQLYTVLWHRDQRDHNGKWHHTSILVELEEVDG
jgi:hypothetical protein